MEDKGEKVFVTIMMTLFSPFVLLGGLFDILLEVTSKALEKIGHKWIEVNYCNTDEYGVGYCLICSPIPCILYRDNDTKEAKSIKIFSRI